MTIKVRRFRKEDAIACSKIKIENFKTVLKGEDSPKTVKYLIKESSPKYVIKRSKERNYFVAVENGKVLGMGGYKGKELHTFFVKRGLHGKGAGKKLLNKVLDEAKKEGIKTIYCASSIYAEKFYASAGFKRMGKGKKVVTFKDSKLSFIWMNKRL